MEEIRNFILGFITQLKTEYGFKISSDRIINLFQVLNKYDFFDEKEVKNVLSSILCQTQEELHVFPSAFNSYFKKAKEAAADDAMDYFISDILDSYNKQKSETEENNIKENAEFEKKTFEIEKADDEIITVIKDIVENISCENPVVLFNVLIKDGSQLFQISQLQKKKQELVVCLLEQEMQEALLYAIENEKDKKVIEEILDACETLTKILNESAEITNRQKEEIRQINREIKKYQSKSHRDTYQKGHNAVQAEKGYLFKDFTQLTDKDLDKINGYIKRNAISIKTRIAKTIKNKTIGKLDYKRTMKKAARTDMIPMELFYRNRKKQKTKIICITDISGSCKNASQILMTFIYALQEAFPGGVETYVFVKELKDATDIVRNYSLKEANERTSVLVERNYSDYNTAFKQFDNEYFDHVTKDTVVIYLGDARNNNNNTGEEYLKKIKNRVKQGHGEIYWLNPEPKSDWNCGDSIINSYSRYADLTMPIENTNDLIHFLNIMF